MKVVLAATSTIVVTAIARNSVSAEFDLLMGFMGDAGAVLARSLAAGVP